MFPLFGNGIIIDSVHSSGCSPDSSSMLLILYRMFVTGSPPAFRSSAVMLPVPGDLLFLSFSIAAINHVKCLFAVVNSYVLLNFFALVIYPQFLGFLDFLSHSLIAVMELSTVNLRVASLYFLCSSFPAGLQVFNYIY